MSYLIRRVLAKPRLILDEMCRLYGKFASYLRCLLCKTRLIFPRINGPIIGFHNTYTYLDSDYLYLVYSTIPHLNNMCQLHNNIIITFNNNNYILKLHLLKRWIASHKSLSTG